MFRVKYVCCVFLVALAPVLVACSGGRLLTNGTPATLVLDRDTGGSVTMTYNVGQPARVWVMLDNAQGQQYVLRNGDERAPSSEPYTLRFDGTAPVANNPEVVQRALPIGEYTYTIQAKTDRGDQDSATGNLSIRGRDIQPPQIQNLVVTPTTISPNADGIDDTAEITYQLPVTATVDLWITRPDGGNRIPIVTSEKQEPKLHRESWNGKTPDSGQLPNGVYTYTLRLQDDYGNIT